MKRIALFAHYDRDGVVDDYVIYYLRGLARVADRILFVSDCDLQAGEAAKLDGLAELVFAGRHGEYDFGSWKRGLAHLNYDLTGWDELILANDSCFAPIYPFEDPFARMKSVNCDFWSPTANYENKEFDHLSSYFLVLRRPVLMNANFLSFLSQVEPQKSQRDVIVKYEIGLSRLLHKLGYKWGALMPPSQIGSFLKTKYVHEALHEHRSPWLKVRLIRDNPFHAAKLGKAIDKTSHLYPRHLIDSHMERLVGMKSPYHHNFSISGDLHFKSYGIEIVCRFKRGKSGKQEKRRFDWRKIYAFVFGVPIFAFAWPVRPVYP